LDFTKESWRWVEPSPFCSNWHIECMCEHFEAVSHRQILRLLINACKIARNSDPLRGDFRVQ
jgi:hypothetical protein